MQKVKLVNPISSPTSSPLKKVRYFLSDLYQVTIQEELTPETIELPQAKQEKSTGSSTVSTRMTENPYNGYCFSTETKDFQTPVINFLPRRPKRFAP
ncbi:hypothetical protein SteCoe_22817 [Stentor coeruleus]|uniref:Uncharacterized protein n=1 Tax=Stentor coeruleus TaxID=5963 RepID=A0A1R2BL72_9CILI|nr:hypothetical protein SteCoe_22817 [Stentor coeruleus]